MDYELWVDDKTRHQMLILREKWGFNQVWRLLVLHALLYAELVPFGRRMPSKEGEGPSRRKDFISTLNEESYQSSVEELPVHRCREIERGKIEDGFFGYMMERHGIHTDYIRTRHPIPNMDSENPISEQNRFFSRFVFPSLRKRGGRH
jgi:hypothetical protein